MASSRSASTAATANLKPAGSSATSQVSSRTRLMHLSPYSPPFSRTVLRHVPHQADQCAADLAVFEARKRLDQGEMEGLRQQGLRGGAIRPVQIGRASCRESGQIGGGAGT